MQPAVKRVFVGDRFFGLAEAYTAIEENLNQAELTVFLSHEWENYVGNQYDEIKKFVSAIKENQPQWKIFLILNADNTNYEDQFRQLAFDDILILDYFLYRSYREIIIHKKSGISNRFSGSQKRNSKFLFLTGKLFGVNRVRLLKKLVDAELMDRAEWSLFYYEHQTMMNALIKSQLPELSDLEFNEFITKWKRNPDNIDLHIESEGVEYNGIPYDVNLYTATDFSIISETSFTNKPGAWITEKTWIPIVNGKPFILAGDTGALVRLEKLGINVFRDFLKIKDYDLITDLEKRLDAIVENTGYWLSNLDLSDEMLKLAIRQNSIALRQLYMYNYDKILNFMYANKLTQLTVDEVVPTVGRSELLSASRVNDTHFKEFYNKIRGAGWPDCERESDFDKLPEQIKKECIDIYGYVPIK